MPTLFSARRLAPCAFALALTLAIVQPMGAHAGVTGTVDCTAPGKADLKFKPQTAVGYFVKKSGSFNLTFFADKLSTAEMRYWVSSEVSARDGQLDGKEHEIDVVAQSRDNRVILVEVRKRQEKSNLTDVEDLRDKVADYANLHDGQSILPAFLSLGGFTAEAQAFCAQAGIATAEQINYVWSAEP